MTETIQHSLYVLKQPVFVLYLDAESAFHFVLTELLVKDLFNCNTTGQCLLYLNNRFQSRQTVIDWGGQLLGPVNDEQGLEQGGVSSSDHYKIFGKQLATAQQSKLGVQLGNQTISGIGQADDTLLLSNNIQSLHHLLLMTLVFCKKYQVKLCAEKTKLQVFSTKQTDDIAEYQMKTFSMKIEGEDIKFVDSAEHVGIVRSTAGNLPTILARFTTNKKALGAVLLNDRTSSQRNHIK